MHTLITCTGSLHSVFLAGHSMAFQPKIGHYALDFGPTSHIYLCPDIKVPLAQNFYNVNGLRNTHS